MDNDLEYAALRRADGTPLPQAAKMRAFEKFEAALRAAGGRAPRDSAGRPLLWNEGLGWHSRDEYRSACPSASPSNGDGWRILSAPHIPHGELEDLAHEIWRHCCPWSAWPQGGWRVRSAEFWGANTSALGMTLFGHHNLILINEAALLRRARALEDSLEGRPGNYLGEEILDTLTHELAHVARGADETDHSPRFIGTLREMAERTPRCLSSWIG